MRRFEVFYRTGGHSGPFHDLRSALEFGERVLRGSGSETAVDIRPYSATGPGGYGGVEWTIRKDPGGSETLRCTKGKS